MVTYLNDIFSLGEYTQALEDGLVRIGDHPEGKPLAIACYTPETAGESLWNDVTMACRGLIYDASTGEVLARPFPKFFNLRDHESKTIAKWLSDAGTYDIYTKHDGSLGVGYVDPETHYVKVATKGSLNHHIGKWATDWLSSSNAIMSSPREREYIVEVAKFFTKCHALGATPLFEIVYPENRIVRDYKGFEGLIPLGAIDIATGEERHDLYIEACAKLEAIEGFEEFGIKVGPDYTEVDMFPRAMYDVLVAEQDPDEVAAGNVEGWILRFDFGDGTSRRVKLKTEEYRKIHHIVTDWTLGEFENPLGHKVLKAMTAGNGIDFDTLKEFLPTDLYHDICVCHDEWLEEVRDREKITSSVLELMIEEMANGRSLNAKTIAGDKGLRAEFAYHIKNNYSPGDGVNFRPSISDLFAALSGKEIDWVDRMIKENKKKVKDNEAN